MPAFLFISQTAFRIDRPVGDAGLSRQATRMTSGAMIRIKPPLHKCDGLP
jgi:hypothetical protein